MQKKMYHLLSCGGNERHTTAGQCTAASAYDALRCVHRDRVICNQFGVGAHAVALLVTARTMRASDTIFGQDKENTIYLNGRETTPSANEVRTVYLNSSIGSSFALIHMNPSLCWYGSAFALFMLLSHRKHKNQQLQWHHSLPRAFQPQAASYIEVHIQPRKNYHL